MVILLLCKCYWEQYKLVLEYCFFQCCHNINSDNFTSRKTLLGKFYCSIFTMEFIPWGNRPMCAIHFYIFTCVIISFFVCISSRLYWWWGFTLTFLVYINLFWKQNYKTQFFYLFYNFVYFHICIDNIWLVFSHYAWLTFIVVFSMCFC